MQCRNGLFMGFALSLWWVTPAAGQEARTPSVVVIADDVWKELAHLAAGAKRETVRCLIGVLQGDTAYIEIAWQPRIHHSSPSSVRYGGCPRAAVAKWHNHLARFASRPTDACYLSDTDVADALVHGAPPLQMVQVNENVMCWWTQGQVGAAAAGALAPLARQFTATFAAMPAFNGSIAGRTPGRPEPN